VGITSLRNIIKQSFRESAHDILSWELNNLNPSIDNLMHQIERGFV